MTELTRYAFELASYFGPKVGEHPTFYQLQLTNRSSEAVSRFRLGFSGPGRIKRDGPIENGSIAYEIGSWFELVPPQDLVLAPGATWTVTAKALEFPMKHWTDGAVTGVVILPDGMAIPAVTRRTANTEDATPPRRGVMRMPVPAPAPAPVPVSIIPWPREVKVGGRRSAPGGFAISAGNTAGHAAAASFKALTRHLFPGEALVRGEREGGFPVSLAADPELRAEAYVIVFSPEGAVVRGAGQTGLLYGLITLGQMARGARLHPQSFSFPNEGWIYDAPELGWRGCHLDVARRFYPSGEIAQFLRILAWNKLNRFHWHLSDDEGWRIEIDAFPQLVETGAWRGLGLPLPPMLGDGPERSGGYYTKAAAREIVALAETLGIEVVPEIDLPGHCHALLVAMPELRDPGESGVYHSIQAFPNNCLNPGVEQVYPVVETILGELCELFASRHFHIGGDEVPADAWQGSPLAEELSARLGTSGGIALQAHFLRRVQHFLAARGKIVGAWEEAVRGGGVEKDDCYLVGWHTVEASQRLAREGYRVVVSPGQAYYLDMANGPEWAEPGANWAGWSSPERTYGFDPVQGWSEEERSRLMGVQACIWSEPMSDRGVFDRLVFPRLSAVAETGWTAPQQRDWERFSALAGLMPSLYGVLDR